MIPDYLMATKRLEQALPESVWWLSNQQTRELFNYSETTRKRDIRLLKGLGVFPQEWKGRYGYDREHLMILWEFRQLQKYADRDFACQHIAKVLEYLNNEQQRQTTSSASSAA